MQFNRCEIAGYLGKKPEVKYTPTGRAVVKVRMAETHRYTNMVKQEVEVTDWHTLVFWGDKAEFAAANYDKGDNLIVNGSYRSRKFTPRDGSERTVWELTVFQSAKLARIGNGKAPDKAPVLNAPQGDDDGLPEESHEHESDDNRAWPA